ncbi:hypothetical protein BDR26DRAFT_856350 [Obelidium mucronatum]|nr:hypothetical protein BDR26DRAFT_856350 [Obelidium mucronatum]
MAKKYKNPTHARKPITIDDNKVPAKDSDDLRKEAFPKAFKLMLRKKDHIEKKKASKSTTAATTSTTGSNTTPKIKPGESVRAFNRRIEEDMRMKVNAAAKAETATAQKRKLRLAERKRKREGKTRKSADKDGEDEAEEKNFPEKEVIPFGVQAQEPPRISVIPKKIGGGAGALRAMKAALEAKEKKEKDAEKKARMERKDKERDGNLPAVGRKTKFKDLPLVKQKNLMEERQRAIEQYRQAKAANRSS